MAKKHSKNLQKVQNMLDGKGTGKLQVGYSTVEETHKVGDRWFDSDGKEWEQKNGYRTNVTKLGSKGIADNCSDCGSYLTKAWDKDSFKYNGRCYYCQIDFEVDLKVKPIRWFAWRRLKDFQNLKALEVEMGAWFEEKEKRLQENPFDKSIANAMANSNVEMTINKNKM
jgi:hypothetical protein